MSKYAIFSMDVEDVSDSFCAKKRKGEEVSMMDGFSSYLNLLDKYEIKGTFFVLANRLEQDKELLQKAISHGHRIGIHGLNHDIVVKLSLDEFKKRVSMAKAQIERTFGIEVLGYRAPGFSIRQEQIDALKELGLKYDSSIQDYKVSNYGAKYDLSSYQEVSDSIYQKDGFTCFKMTLSTGRPLHHMPIGGGGYLRMPPQPFVKRVLLKTIAERSLYIFYCHPFEVSNVKAPKVKGLTPLEYSYLRRGRSTYLAKIEQLILRLKKEGYEFVTFDDLTKQSA